MWDVWESGELPTGLWWEGLREKGHLEDLGVDGRIILKWKFKNRNKDRRLDRLDRSGLGQGQADCCECGIKPPSSIRYR
jgi:hypothetical protein